MIIQLGLSVYDNKVPVQTFRRSHHGDLSTGCRVGSGVENHEPQGNCFRLTT